MQVKFENRLNKSQVRVLSTGIEESYWYLNHLTTRKEQYLLSAPVGLSFVCFLSPVAEKYPSRWLNLLLKR